MRLEIKEIAQHRDGAYGKFWIVSKRRACITISRKANTTVNWYSLTLLHELLHLYCAMIKMKGAKIDRRKEHKFIEKIENFIVKSVITMKAKGGW
jgi:hypothetical protein